MKTLKKYGEASKNYTSMEWARFDTYTTRDDTFPPTNIACKENPYKDELNTAKYILDFGCGVGRNLPWIMKNTNATYVGLDPNLEMIKYFWDVQESEGHPINEWKSRVELYNTFEQVPDNLKFDYVISTFVMQHLGYRYNEIGAYNLTDITKNILSRMNTNAIFFALEHDHEEDWITRWLYENNLKLDVYLRGYKGLPELTDRDFLTTSGHHLMIFKKLKEI